MTIFERKTISEAYKSITEDSDISIIVSRVFLDDKGEEVDTEEVLQKTFSTPEEAIEYIKSKYHPTEWDDKCCVTDPKLNYEGSQFIRIDTKGFTFGPIDDDDGIDENSENVSEDNEIGNDTPEVVTEWN